MVAALVAVFSPVRAVRSRDPLAAASTNEGAASSPRPALTDAGGAACLVAATVILLVAPKLAIAGMLMLVGALLLLLGSALSAAVRALAITARRITGVVGHVAAMELTAARSRILGVAATGAVAVFGAVAIQGAHGDLLKGLENAARDENAYTDYWGGAGRRVQLAANGPIRSEGAAAEAGTSASREDDQGGSPVGLAEWGTRRVWGDRPTSGSETIAAGIASRRRNRGDCGNASPRRRLGGGLQSVGRRTPSQRSARRSQFRRPTR